MNRLARGIGRILLGAIILSIAAFIVLVIVVNNICDNTVKDRVADIATIVAEENCLSNEVGMPAADKLLKVSENTYLKFSTKSSSYNGKALSYRVYRAGDSKKQNLFTYDSATNRNAAIVVEVTGYMVIKTPLVDQPVERAITESVTVMGLKYYKDKPLEK